MPLRTSKGSKAYKRSSVAGPKRSMNMRSTARAETQKAVRNDQVQAPVNKSDVRAENAAALAGFQSGLTPIRAGSQGQGRHNPQLLVNSDFWFGQASEYNQDGWTFGSGWVIANPVLPGILWTFASVSTAVTQTFPQQAGAWYQISVGGYTSNNAANDIELTMSGDVVANIPRRQPFSVDLRAIKFVYTWQAQTDGVGLLGINEREVPVEGAFNDIKLWQITPHVP